MQFEQDDLTGRRRHQARSRICQFFLAKSATLAIVQGRRQADARRLLPLRRAAGGSR